MTDLQHLDRNQTQRRAMFTQLRDGYRVTHALGRTLSAKEPAQTIFLIGRFDDLPSPAELIDAPLSAGWQIQRYINVAEREGERRLAVTYTRDEHRVEVRSAAEWFGGDLSPQLAERAWVRLGRDLRALFGERAVLLTSPAQTGQDLLERSLPRKKLADGKLEAYTFPTLPDEALDMLYTTCGQGRNELFHQPQPIERLYGLDGVWMYASCLSALPCGPMTYDTRPDPPGWTCGFLVASVHVPDGWAHVGLLPEVYDDARGAHRRWPRSGWFVSVMTTAEYDLAIKQGWDVRIKRRWLWHKPPCDPAGLWRDKLVSLRRRYQLAAHRGDVVAMALQATVRRLMLNPIGLWFSHEAFTDSYVPRSEAGRIALEAHVSVRGDYLHVRTPREFGHPLYQHPEWAASVWGRARAKLATWALKLPYYSIGALRTDEIWSTVLPNWPDTDKPGEFRLKETIDDNGLPFLMPTDETTMRLLLTRARRV